MSNAVLYMSMSLDGFIAGPNESPDNGLGDGGERLHEWLSGERDQASGIPGRPPDPSGQIFDESMSTGAVVAGKGTFEPAGGWGGDHHDGVPIWILSRGELGIDISQWPLVTHVTDVETAISEAKRAAGDKDVLVHGAAVAQLAEQRPSTAQEDRDEVDLELVEQAGQIELEPIRVIEAPDVTHLRFRVRNDR